MSFHPANHNPMKSLKTSLAAIASAILMAAMASAQTKSSDFEITKVLPELVKTPDINFSGGPTGKGKGKGRDFLAVEVIFSWQPRDQKAPTHLEEVTVNYYILLNNKGQIPDNPTAETLLTGSVTHVSVPQGKDLKSVIYVSPRTLEKFFRGKVPATLNNIVRDAGATIIRDGETVAQGSAKADLRNKTPWWAEMPSTDGLLLNKNQTPFAPLIWDHYEEIKPANAR